MAIPTRSWSGLAAGQPVDAAQMITFLDALRTPFNTAIENDNIKVGANIDAAKLADATIATAKLAAGAVTSAKIASTGVEDSNLKWGAGGITALRAPVANRKVKYGTLAILAATFGTTANYTTGNIGWNTIDDDESVNFSATPRCVAILRHTEAKALVLTLDACTASLVNFRIRTGDAVAHAAAGTINIDWIAIGAP